MKDKQARELVELRAFLTSRGLTAELCREDDGALNVRVPPDQEDRLREALDEWSRTRLIWTKRPQKPEGPVKDGPASADPPPGGRSGPGSRRGLAVIDTSRVVVTDELEGLVERLAEHAHNSAVREKLLDGWSRGPEFDADRRTDPGLVPYSDLSDAGKEAERFRAAELIRAALALGYRITKG